MSAYEWCALAAVCALTVTGITYWTRSADSREYRGAWGESTRTEDDVRADVTAAKADRDQLQAADDLTACLAIWDATQHDIPHQTRRTEDNQ